MAFLFRGTNFITLPVLFCLDLTEGSGFRGWARSWSLLGLTRCALQWFEVGHWLPTVLWFMIGLSALPEESANGSWCTFSFLWPRYRLLGILPYFWASLNLSSLLWAVPEGRLSTSATSSSTKSSLCERLLVSPRLLHLRWNGYGCVGCHSMLVERRSFVKSFIGLFENLNGFKGRWAYFWWIWSCIFVWICSFTKGAPWLEGALLAAATNVLLNTFLWFSI